MEQDLEEALKQLSQTDVDVKGPFCEVDDRLFGGACFKAQQAPEKVPIRPREARYECRLHSLFLRAPRKQPSGLEIGGYLLQTRQAVYRRKVSKRITRRYPSRLFTRPLR